MSNRSELAASASDPDSLGVWQRSATPLRSTSAAVLLTLAVIFVMVVKPTL